MLSTVKISTHQIRKQVDKICFSTELNTKLQLCRLFRYLVDETLAGREEKLKGFTIGLEVFKKVKDFDPEHDPIVRIHAGRLRRMLKMYYLEAGKNDPVLITIPKGKYIPFFVHNEKISEKQSSTPVYQKSFPTEPTVAIMPFKNLSGNPDKDYFALGLAEELSVELTKFDDLIVFGSIPFADNKLSEAAKNEFIKQKGIRFIVEGGIHHLGNKIKILVRLIDSVKEEQIWAERYTQEMTSDNLNEIQEIIALEISCVLGSEYGIILQQLSQESKRNKANSIDTIDAIMRFHYFEAHQTPEAALQAFSSLEQALKKDPHSGIATAMLASMYGNRFMLDIPTSENAYEQMGILIEKAKNLDPNSLSVKVLLTWKYFAYNEKEKFFNEVEKCLSMNPNSPARLGALGQYLSLYGDWERGKDFLDRAMQMNVSFPLYYYGATTLYYYRKKEYEKALLEANQYNIPALFWGPLLRTAVLGQLGMLTEAKPNIKHLQQLKPDFKEKARYLISRFVKEEELVEHVMEGLRKAGMEFS